jgi:N-acetylglutamate synthase-like GNAT family acetyltransferase
MACDLSVRRASEGDIPALHALIESAYRGETARRGWTHEADLVSTPRTSRDALLTLMRDPDEALLAAYDGAQLVGCFQLTSRAGGIAYVGLITVAPHLQARGLGKALLAEAEAAAQALFGAQTLELSVVTKRPELVAYYARRGFSATGELIPFPVAVDPPLQLQIMRKPITGDKPSLVGGW